MERREYRVGGWHGRLEGSHCARSWMCEPRAASASRERAPTHALPVYPFYEAARRACVPLAVDLSPTYTGAIHTRVSPQSDLKRNSRGA